MYLNYVIIFIIAVCSLLSAIEVDCIKHKKILFWKISFYFSIYLFIPSFMKYLLGHHKENLLECFWNPRLITLAHYGIPLLIIAVVSPIILKLLFKENVIDIIRFFDSSLYFVLSLAFVLTRKINNQIYCAVFVIAVVATLMAVILKKTKAVYVGVADIKNIIIESAPIFACYFMTVVIYTPNELYLYNASDFPISYWYFFGKLLAAGVIVTIILLVGTLLYLNQVHIKLYLTVMFVLLAVGYIQGMFLNGKMAVLDGAADNSYDKLRVYINLAIWIIISAALIIFSIKKSHVAEKFMRVVSIWITLIQLASLAVIIISSNETAPKGEMALTTEGMLDVGEKNNIIVFILDKFDGSYVDEILEETPDFFEPLNDFVSYENATSMFCPTGKSIPYLLTGVKYQGGGTYAPYANENDILIKDIKNSGYEVGVYTAERFDEDYEGYIKDIISNYKDGVRRTCGMWKLFSLMTQCSRYKMAPLCAKNYYIYDTSDIDLLVENDIVVNVENDVPFYQRLTKDGLKISGDNSEGTYRFIHMHGAHPPYTMTEDFQYVEYDYRRDGGYNVSGVSQWKGAVKIVYEYIRQLKELGKYDDALIIITADHGITSDLSDSKGNMLGVSYPILFVKQPYESHEKMVVSDAPVCHTDVIATIRKKVGIATSDRGLEEIDTNENRKRYMINSGDGFMKTYEIDGDVRLIENWRLISMEETN